MWRTGILLVLAGCGPKLVAITPPHVPAPPRPRVAPRTADGWDGWWWCHRTAGALVSVGDASSCHLAQATCEASREAAGGERGACRDHRAAVCIGARDIVQGKQMWCHMHMSECEARRAYLLDSPDHDEPGACKVIRQE